MVDDTQKPGYRGKCLYKTGKCNNERALKTSGTPHNLCDEHRNRQNEHQRKLDAKNRGTRKEKRIKSNTRAAPYVRSRKSDVNGYHNHESTSSTKATHAFISTVTSVVGSVTNGFENENKTSCSVPYPVKDFDGIVVPLPSFLEGQERIEFRSKVYQKVLDYISEEYVNLHAAKTRATGIPECTGSSHLTEENAQPSSSMSKSKQNPKESLSNTAAQGVATELVVLAAQASNGLFNSKK
jgi:hypothetical protein